MKLSDINPGDIIEATIFDWAPIGTTFICELDNYNNRIFRSLSGFTSKLGFGYTPDKKCSIDNNMLEFGGYRIFIGPIKYKSRFELITENEE